MSQKRWPRLSERAERCQVILVTGFRPVLGQLSSPHACLCPDLITKKKLIMVDRDRDRRLRPTQDGNVAAFCAGLAFLIHSLSLSLSLSLSHFPNEFGSPAFCVPIWAPVKVRIPTSLHCSRRWRRGRSNSCCVSSTLYE